MADEVLVTPLEAPLEAARRLPSDNEEKTASDERSTPVSRPTFIEQRFVAALGVHPVLAGLMVAVAAMATYFMWQLALHDAIVRIFAASYNAQRGAWPAFVWSLLLGYIVAVMTIVPMSARADTIAVMNLVPPARVGEIVAQLGYSANTLRRAQRFGVISGLLGLVGLIYSAWMILAPTSLAVFLSEFFLAFGWYIVIVPITLFFQGRAAFIMLNGSRVGRALILPMVQFDILDLAPFAPFARMALRNAGAWLAGSFIISLFFLRAPFKDSASVLVLVGLSFALAVAALVTPLLSVHRLIVARKGTELDVLHVAIDRDRAELLARSGDATAASQRLQGLLAYRAAVENMREWPLDVSVLVRFGLYLVLPVLGWTAGALVDHFLNVYLGSG